jgi:hypothetical protein
MGVKVCLKVVMAFSRSVTLQLHPLVICFYKWLPFDFRNLLKMRISLLQAKVECNQYCSYSEPKT